MRKASLGEHPSLSFLSLVPPPASFSPPQSTHLHRRTRPVAWVPSPSFSTVTTVSVDACSSILLRWTTKAPAVLGTRQETSRFARIFSQRFHIRAARPPGDDLLQGRFGPIGGGQARTRRAVQSDRDRIGFETGIVSGSDPYETQASTEPNGSIVPSDISRRGNTTSPLDC